MDQVFFSTVILLNECKTDHKNRKTVEQNRNNRRKRERKSENNFPFSYFVCYAFNDIQLVTLEWHSWNYRIIQIVGNVWVKAFFPDTNHSRKSCALIKDSKAFRLSLSLFLFPVYFNFHFLLLLLLLLFLFRIWIQVSLFYLCSCFWLSENEKAKRWQ